MLPKDWLKSLIGAALAFNQKHRGAKLPLLKGKRAREMGGGGAEQSTDRRLEL